MAALGVAPGAAVVVLLPAALVVVVAAAVEVELTGRLVYVVPYMDACAQKTWTWFCAAYERGSLGQFA